MIIRSLFITICLILLGNNHKLTAQSIINNPIIVPPSPSVAAFQKFDFSEINLYNGIPSVQIPIYEIKEGDLSYPITLSYSYNGFKVEEVAGWLGLGWSLSAEGMISRIVRGKPDESSNFGYSTVRQLLSIPDPVVNPHEFATFTSTISDSSDILRKFADGTYDGIPDEYIIKANNLTGSIIELNSGDFVTNPFKRYKISRSTIYNNSYNHWEVIDELGNIYKFGKLNDEDVSGVEKTKYEYYNSILNSPYVENYVSNWFIKEIVTPTNNKIKFNYTSEQIARVPSINDAAYRKISTQHDCPIPPIVRSIITHFPATTWRLSSIESKSVKVMFYSATPRNDIISGSTSYCLDSIVIKDCFNRKINKYVFTYGYLGNINSNESCRMILKQLTEYGSDNNKKPPYLFEYNESQMIPPYSSKGIDFWGFYNGINGNENLIPAEVPNSIHNSYFNIYADRTPNWNYSSKGLLTKIKTPTKGSIEYIYEPNDCGNVRGDEVAAEPIIEQTNTTIASIQSGSTILSTSENFTIEDQQTVDVNYIISNNNYPIDDYDSVSLKKWRSFEPPILLIKSNNISEFRQIDLTPGTYEIKATVSTQGHSASIKVTSRTYKKDISGNIIYNKSLAVGGHRLQKSIHYDDLDHSNDKILFYEYTMPNNPNYSSGILYAPLVFEYSTNLAEVVYIGQDPGTAWGPPQDGTWCNYIVRSSSGIYPLSGRDGFLGYEYVLVKEGEQGENGSTLYQFTTNFDQIFPEVSQPISRSHLRGRIKSITVSNNNKDILSLKENYYSSSLSENMKGIGGLFLVQYEENSIQDYLDKFKIPYWGIIYSEWDYLEKSVEKKYFNRDSLVITKTFSYNNPVHAQITKISEINSDGRLVEDYFYYPWDTLSDIITLPGIINSLKLNNMHVKLKKETRIDEEIVEGYITDYGVGLLPVSISKLENEVYKSKIHYDEYDQFGNLLQYRGTNNIKASYYWSYNSNYPVVEAFNISNDELESFVNIAAANSGLSTINWISDPITEKSKWLNFNSLLRSLCGLNTMISTYTYKPQIGITSATDAAGIITYYEYDSFSRLALVKDSDGNILQSYDYNYKK